jgi:hypothetical protein
LPGLWDEWNNPETGEVVPSYTMITQNCDGHPLLGLMVFCSVAGIEKSPDLLTPGGADLQYWIQMKT